MQTSKDDVCQLGLTASNIPCFVINSTNNCQQHSTLQAVKTHLFHHIFCSKTVQIGYPISSSLCRIWSACFPKCYISQLTHFLHTTSTSSNRDWGCVSSLHRSASTTHVNIRVMKEGHFCHRYYDEIIVFNQH